MECEYCGLSREDECTCFCEKCGLDPCCCDYLEHLETCNTQCHMCGEIIIGDIHFIENISFCELCIESVGEDDY